jgi:hypothetical protein
MTAFTRALDLSLSWAIPTQSTLPNPTSARSILILYAHLRLGLPSGFYPSDFPTNNLQMFLYPPIRITCPSQLIHHDFIILIIPAPRNVDSSTLPSLHPPFGPNILLSTMFSNTLYVPTLLSEIKFHTHVEPQQIV